MFSRQYVAILLVALLLAAQVSGVAIASPNFSETAIDGEVMLEQNVPIFGEDVKEESKITMSSKGIEGNYYINEDFTDPVLIRLENTGLSFNIDKLRDNASPSMRQKLSQVKSIQWVGLIKPDYSEDYQFSSSQLENVHVKVNGQSVIDAQGISKPINMTKGKEYRIQIDYLPKGNLSNLKISWESKSKPNEVVPFTNLLLPKQSNPLEEKATPIRKPRLMQKAGGEDEKEDKVDCKEGDTDCDGIQDTWETSGYTFIPGLGVVQWNNEFEDKYNVEKYVTSPTDASTDQDPYSDYEEVVGLVDASIEAPADHPLIPAFPDIQADISSIQFTPNQEISLENGQTISSGWSTSTEQSKGIVTDVGETHSLHLTGSYTAKAGTETGVEKSFTAEYGFEHSENVATEEVTTKSSSTEGAQESSWARATTSNPSEAATAILNVRYKNKGTAPVYEMSPTLSLSVGETTALTLKPSETLKANTLAPGKVYPKNGTIALQKVGENENILLTLDQVKLIQMGHPISLSTNQVDAKVKRIEDGKPTVEYDWSWYENSIDAVTTDITFLSKNSKEKHLKIYANDPGKRNAQFKPDVTFGEALAMGFNAELRDVDGVNKLYIEGEEVTRSWRIHLSSDNISTVDYSDPKFNIVDMKLDPSMKIVIEKPDETGKPYINYAFYSDNGKQVVVDVFANGSAIESVKAILKPINAKAQTIELNDDGNGVYKLKDIPTTPFDVTYRNAEIEVKAKNGQTIKSPLLTPFNMVTGMGYVPLPREEVTNADKLADKYPNAQYFVVDMVSQGSVGPERLVRFGEQTSSMGTASLEEYDYVKAFKNRNQKYCINNCPSIQISSEKNYSYTAPFLITMDRLWIQDFKDKTGWGLQMNSFQNIQSIRMTNNNDKRHKLVLFRSLGLDKHEPYAVIDESIPDLNSFQDVVTEGTDRVLNFAGMKRFVVYDGPVYRFYEDVNYQGDFQDFIIGSKNVLNHLNNKFSSVKVFDPPSGLGISVFDGDNFSGNILSITEDIPNLDAVGFNDRISSVKIVSNLPHENPTHNTTMIVSAEDIANIEVDGEYFGGETKMYLQGVYKAGGDKFTEYNQSKTYSTSGNYTFETGVNKASGYLVQVTGHNIASDKITIKLNNSATSELGTSASQEAGRSIMKNIGKLPTHSNLMFVPANSNSPSTFNVNIQTSDGERSTTLGINSKFTVNVLGYFAADNVSSQDYSYEQINSPIAVKSPSVINGQTSFATLNSNEFNNTPRAYLVKVKARNIGGNAIRFTVNNRKVELGTAASEHSDGAIAAKVTHDQLLYVPADSSSPYKLTMMPEYGGWNNIGRDSAFDLEVVGYFYGSGTMSSPTNGTLDEDIASENEEYIISSKHTGKVLDVASKGTHNTAKIQQWDYLKADNQAWKIVNVKDGYYKILNVHSGKALDVADWSRENEGNVFQYDFLGGDNQLWKIEKVDNDYYKLINKHSGKALDVAKWSKENGGNIFQYDYHGGDNQLWKIEKR